MGCPNTVGIQGDSLPRMLTIPYMNLNFEI